MLAHNTAVMAGVASIESKLDNELLFIDDGELSDHFDAVKKEVDEVQQNVDDVKSQVGDVKLQVIEAHSHIEALIGLPSDIPSINNRRRKRDGNADLAFGIILIVVCCRYARHWCQYVGVGSASDLHANRRGRHRFHCVE
jgi:hypothetical protein